MNYQLGKDLIKKMTDNKGSSWWSWIDLKEYIKKDFSIDENGDITWEKSLFNEQEIVAIEIAAANEKAQVKY